MGESQSTCRPCHRAGPETAPLGPDDTADARSAYEVGGGLKPLDKARLDRADSSGLAIEGVQSPIKGASARPSTRTSDSLHAKIEHKDTAKDSRASSRESFLSKMESSPSLPVDLDRKRKSRRAETLTRGSTWLRVQMRKKDPLSTAADIVKEMLEEDELGPGQVADLEYIQRVLIDQLHRGDKLGEKVKHNVQHMEQDETVDDTTLEYLKTFAGTGQKRKHRTFREVAKAVYFTQSLRRVLSAPSTSTGAGQLLLCSNNELLKALEEFDHWNRFDIFYVSGLANSAVLEYVGLMAIQRHQLLPQFNISLPKLRCFLAEIEKQYLANPYHNSLHAADVVQTVHNILRAAPESGLSEIEVMTSLFAATCHDVGHGGVQNSFRVASLDDGALTYNDVSVNEHMHCSITYRTLLRDECNWLDSLTREQALSVRKMFIEIVLATDMQFHFSKVQKVKQIIEEKGNQIYKWETSTPFLELLVHGADISNPTKPEHIALKWTDRVLEEFFAQGDEERRLGRACSPLCDRNTVSKAGSQNGFIEFIVQPTIEVLGKLCELRTPMANLKSYHTYWQNILKEEKEAAEVLPSNAESSRKLVLTGKDRVKNLKRRKSDENLVPPVRGRRALKMNSGSN